MSEFFEVLEQRVWPFVNRPARYIGNEYGLVRKAPESVRLRAAFVYPDLYEVGMSNLGLKVLYRVANSIDSVAAERSFVPWPDMEKLMRLHGVPLYSLETYSALSDFDLLGITLQSELTYTNVLAVLDLAGIPLESGRRDSGRWPLVAGGGPCAVNVRPLERFFDFFLLGDGEDAFREIAGALLSLETDGKEYTRAGKLEVLGSLEGVYVPPGRTGSPGPVRVRRVFDLKTSDAPDGLPVPLIEVAQHNYVVELMRGCTVGCRFCQAGMYYRPVRVRPPGQVADLVRQGVRSGGWESVTLLSLSSADYPAIEELVDELMPEIQGSGLTLSFPSLRVDESTLRLLERISGAKRSGLTFAVEAGSERLRRVIGKKVIEDDLVNLVTRVFTSGWTLVKLYFMVGLPTETGQDVDDIARLINRMAAIGRSVPGRHNVNVTLSPFVPKPCTPFQWEAQDDPGSILEKFDRIRSQVRTRRVRFKCHDPWAAVIEGVLCRGGSELGSVLRTAWAGGARLDGWSEHFDFAVWEKAFQEHGLDWRALLAETSDTMELPWKTVDAPVTESFLKQQREAGLQGQIVRDCDGGPCLDCGAGDPETCKKLRSVDSKQAAGVIAGGAEPLSKGPLPMISGGEQPRKTWRVQYAKQGLLRFCGHLDMVRNIEFILRRSGLPVCYSSGFSPRMRLHFSAPLPLGLESRCEFFDLDILPRVTELELRKALERQCAALDGLAVRAVRLVPPGLMPSLAEDICLCSYRVRLAERMFGEATDLPAWLERCKAGLLESGATVEWTDRKRKVHSARVEKAVESVTAQNTAPGGEPAFVFELALRGEGACRPDRFLACLLKLEQDRLPLLRIEKVQAFIKRGAFLKSPMEF